MDKQTSESIRDFFVQYPLYAIVDEWLRPVAWWAVVTTGGWFITWWRHWRWQREFRGAAISFIALTIILVLLTSRTNERALRTIGHPRDFATGKIVSTTTPVACGHQMSEDMRTALAGELQRITARHIRLPKVSILVDPKQPKNQMATAFLKLFNAAGWQTVIGFWPEAQKGNWFAFADKDALAREFYSSLQDYPPDIRPNSSGTTGTWFFYFGSDWCDGNPNSN